MEHIDFYLERVSFEDKEVLYRLLQYSLFEESETDLNEMNSDGIFEYHYFDSYFQSEERYAFFIKEKQSHRLLGFVMVNDYVEGFDNGKSIAEFLVIPKYRRLKIGERVAYEVFDMFATNWEVKPSLGSDKAYNFWLKTITKYTNGNYAFENNTFTFCNIK